MTGDFFDCPHCGQRLMKGAMRCVGCGKILKTAEEQQASIERYRESKKRFKFARLLKFIILLLIILAIIFHKGIPGCPAL